MHHEMGNVQRFLNQNKGLHKIAQTIALERSLPPELVACRSEREMSEVIRKSVRGILENFARPLPRELQAMEASESQG